MNNIAIEKARWVEIYNSIILLLFFRESYKNNQNSIIEINKIFNEFCLKNSIIGNDFHFEGGSNSLSFCYLIIVRIIEIINNATGGNSKIRKALFKCTIEAAKENGVLSFDDIITKYEIEIQIFAYSNNNDEEKLYQLFRHIRHAISHFSYKIDSTFCRVSFISTNTKTKKVELDIAIPIYHLLNLTADFGCWVNNTLHKRHLLI